MKLPVWLVMQAKTVLITPLLLFPRPSITIPGEEVIKGLLSKAGMDVTVIGGVAGGILNLPVPYLPINQRVIPV